MKILLIILLSLFPMTIRAQVLSNLDLMSNLANKSAKEIASYLDSRSIDSFSFHIVENPSSFLIESALIEAFQNKSIRKSNLQIANNHLMIQVVDYRVSYSEPNPKCLSREAVLNLYCTITNSDGNIEKINVPIISTKDTITWDEARLVNSNSPYFAQGNLPPQPATLFKRLIEPVIITTSAILTVVLFFSIRSK